ncbi:MAG: glycosyltransferase family 4 protein [Planctomycetes bacterium]|nr:glycosyltransferase family 4 protein [Planctomycetota bacterium]
MRIGIYLGSWRLTQLGGMGVYLKNLLQAVNTLASSDAAIVEGSLGQPPPRLVLLVDRANRGAAQDLGIDAEIAPLDRPTWDQIPPDERRRVIAVRALSYRDPGAADAQRGLDWSDAASQYLWGLDESIRAAEVDVLYCTIPPYIKRPRVPIVLTIHDLKHIHRPQDHDRADLARRRRWARIARAADVVYSSYEHVRADVVASLGVRKSRTAVLPVAVAAHLRRAARSPTVAIDATEPFALMPAQFWVHKNHSLVFLALSRLAKNGGLTISLVCTGQTEGQCAAHAASMRELARRLGIENRVRFLGHVRDAEMEDLYRRCRMVIVATLYDPGSFPVLEALAYGKPLIASSVTTIPETVGDAAVLFDPTDVQDLATAMKRVWEDESLRNELSRRGPARVPTRTWATTALEWLGLCRRAIEHQAASQGALATTA